MKDAGLVIAIMGGVVSVAVLVAAPIMFFPFLLIPAVLMAIAGVGMLAAGHVQQGHAANQRQLAELIEKMHPIHFACPTCHRVNEVPRSLAGQMIACACCGQCTQLPPVRPTVVQAAPAPAPYPIRRKSSDWWWYLIVLYVVLGVGAAVIFMVAKQSQLL